MFRLISLLYYKLRQKYLQGKAVRNSNVDPTATIQSGSQFVNSTMGRHSYCAYNCSILNTVIGNFCSIAPNVIIGSAQHPMNWASTSPAFEDVKNSSPRKRFAHFSIPEPSKTIIGSDVWIGDRVIIKGGVTIGHGVVIGAGAVVTKDVEPYAIVGGCPAKLIRYRFDEETRTALLKSQWWELDDSRISIISDDILNPALFAYNAYRINNQEYITPPPPLHTRRVHKSI